VRREARLLLEPRCQRAKGGPEATSKTINMASLEASLPTIAERLQAPGSVGRLYAQASELKRNGMASFGQRCLTANRETSHGVSCEIWAVTHGLRIASCKTSWCLMKQLKQTVNHGCRCPENGDRLQQLPGGSTYRRGIFVQTTGTSSVRPSASATMADLCYAGSITQKKPPGLPGGLGGFHKRAGPGGRSSK
jgi:hypothetical protein